MILRHLEKADWPAVPSMPHFDGFVFHSGQEDASIRDEATELAQTKPGFLYVQVLTRPPADWGNPTGIPWLDAVNAYTQPLVAPDGRKAVAWAFGRELIDWHLVDGGKIDALAATIMNEVRAVGLHGALLDLAFSRTHEWMFRYDGPPYASFPAAWWPYWERRFRKFVQVLGARFNAGGSQLRILLNGDRVAVPVPGTAGRAAFYREHSQLNWVQESVGWGSLTGKAAGDVLSVLADDTEAVYRLLAASEANPEGWIAFTGHTTAAINQAYELAAEAA